MGSWFIGCEHFCKKKLLSGKTVASPHRPKKNLSYPFFVHICLNENRNALWTHWLSKRNVSNLSSAMLKKKLMTSIALLDKFNFAQSNPSYKNNFKVIIISLAFLACLENLPVCPSQYEQLT